ncbi:MFS transporter [Nocardioides sp. CN2-186]|uniref:MFS transporter n=1 Tax=Nocardioides tweenelious TaxID=3156607 RepID=UPI0032B3EA17
MKRPLSFENAHELGLVLAGTGLIAATYGLVRLAYGLYLSDIQASLDLGPAAAGYISSGASIAYCAGALVGLVGDSRPRLLVLAAAGTGSSGALGMALAPSAAAFVPAAIIGSVGAGLASPGLVGVVARNVAEQGRDRAQAVVNSGTGPGLVLAGLLALALLPDWRLGFVIAAVVTAAVGAAVLLLSRRSTGPAARSADQTASSWRRMPVLATPAVGAVLLGASSAAVWTYGRTQLVAEGVGAGTATLAWIGLGVGGAATVVTARVLSRLRPARAWVLTTSGVALSVGALAVVAGGAVGGIAACLLFGWAFVAATSALIAWAAELLPDRAAAGTALLFVALTLGQAVGSAVAGTIADATGLSVAFAAAALTALPSTACGLRRGHAV